jgi:hypothetical protein
MTRLEEPLSPCKTCGTMPVYVDIQGDINQQGYICPKTWSGECKSSEKTKQELAAMKWNEQNDQT